MDAIEVIELQIARHIMTRRSVDHLLHYMPAVAREATDPWVQTFARDMTARRNWRNWSPSQKQRIIMEKLVNELFSTKSSIVIEDE